MSNRKEWETVFAQNSGTVGGVGNENWDESNDRWSWAQPGMESIFQQTAAVFAINLGAREGKIESQKRKKVTGSLYSSELGLPRRELLSLQSFIHGQVKFVSSCNRLCLPNPTLCPSSWAVEEQKTEPELRQPPSSPVNTGDCKANQRTGKLWVRMTNLNVMKPEDKDWDAGDDLVGSQHCPCEDKQERWPVWGGQAVRRKGREQGCLCTALQSSAIPGLGSGLLVNGCALKERKCTW